MEIHCFSKLYVRPGIVVGICIFKNVYVCVNVGEKSKAACNSLWSSTHQRSSVVDKFASMKETDRIERKKKCYKIVIYSSAAAAHVMCLTLMSICVCGYFD